MENCTTFGQLILSKIIKIVATSCQILRLQCTKFDFDWGSTPDPAARAHSAPPNPLTGFKGPTYKGRGGQRRSLDGGKGKGRRVKGGAGHGGKKNGGEGRGRIGKGCLLLNGGLVMPLPVASDRPVIPSVTVHIRSRRRLDVDAFRSRLAYSVLCQPSAWPSDVDAATTLYDVTIMWNSRRHSADSCRCSSSSTF